MLARTWTVALVAASVAAATSTGSAGQAEPQGSPLILRATTRLVQVEVIVRDGSGKPVTGLGRNDFEVFEDGKRQEVRFFTGYTGRPREDSDLLPGMLSNRPEITGPRRGVTVVLIDSLNTAWEYRSRALANLLTFLDGAQPDDRIAIYTLGGELKIFHEFTSDARALKKKIEQLRHTAVESQGEEPLLNALIERNPQLVDAQTASLLRWTQGTEQAARGKAYAEATFDTLEKVANHLGSTPGWKSLMWISGGVPMQVDGRPFDKEFEKAARALSNSNVAVYPIDPAGLQGEGRSGLQHDTNSVLRQLADRTGGRAYIDQNDILGALKQVTDTAQASYTVAYYPANERFDGKYREIQVRVKKPGLTASHRKGYYALDTAELGRQDGDKTVRAAALDPLDAAVIGIDAGLRKADDGQDEVVARIDTAELLWPDKDRFDLKTSVGVFQYDAGGRQLEGVVDDIDFTCDAARAQLFSRNGLSYGRKIALQPSASRLRLVVRSKRTGAIGSITIPIPAR